MDARKIQFLIGIQREIDKLEAKDGNTPKVERVKSRFYDVVEVEEIMGEPKIGVSKPETGKDIVELAVGSDTDITSFSGYDDLIDLVDGLSEEDFLSPEQAEEVMKRMVQNDIIGGEAATKSISVATRKNPIGIKKKLTFIEEDYKIEVEKIIPHKPKDVAAFLVRFRERKNRGLKYLTHRWSDIKRDQALTYEEVIENAKNEFQECIDLYVIPEMLKSKVREFVRTKSWSGTNKKGYPAKHPQFFYSVVNNGGVERVIVDSGWSSDEMIEWAKKNPRSDPNQDSYWTGKLIQPFKRAIEIRDGMLEEYLRTNAEAVLKERYQQFNPIYGDSLEDIRFFTDVPVLFEGIRQLLHAANEKAKQPALRFEFVIPESDALYGVRQIKIMTDKNPQIGSFITKKQLIKGGNFGEAYDHFYGLCNWSILCQRGSEYIRMNLLSDIDGIGEIEPVECQEVEGFTHVLTFYDL